MGASPAAAESRVDGMNQGINGRRSCGAIVGTCCGGELQGSFANKQPGCHKCDFYQMVCVEQGPAMQDTIDILYKLKKG